MLRHRIASKEDIENSLVMKNLEWRFRLVALYAECGELYYYALRRKLAIRYYRSYCTISIC